jgi:Uma2 family endonuclease
MHEYTIADYVRFENGVETKHEYVYGSIIAMAGGTLNHAALIAQIIVQLGGAVRGSGCRVFSSELRIRVAGQPLILYPDATVLCGGASTDQEDNNALLNPVLIAEVTSSSTEKYDRGKKYGYYQRVPTLREYVVVSHARRLVEVFRRSGNGWSLAEQASGGQLRLASVTGSLDIDELYAGLHL